MAAFMQAMDQKLNALVHTLNTSTSNGIGQASRWSERGSAHGGMGAVQSSRPGELPAQVATIEKESVTVVPVARAAGASRVGGGCKSRARGGRRTCHGAA
eukprot:2289238-Pleurochrysis_carterae.AAC.2